MSETPVTHTLAADLAQLLQKPSADLKSQLSDKISQSYQQNAFSEGERKIAEEVLKILSSDKEVEIRRILANNLKDSTTVPHEIALKLAKDVEEVATPILQFSPVLKEEDLLNIVRSAIQMATVSAVAKRSDVTDVLAGAILDTAHPDAANQLMINDKIKLSDETILRAVNEFHPFLEATNADGATQQMRALIADMHKAEKLTESMLIRSLCKGNILFFELALAKMSDNTHDYVHDVVSNLNQAQFQEIYVKAKLPDSMLNALYIITKLAVQEFKAGTTKAANYSNRIVEKIIAGGYDTSVPMMPQLMALMSCKAN